MPGAIAGTLVTMPENGAVTVVWSSSRCASSTWACACRYWGCCGGGDVRIAGQARELHLGLSAQGLELALVGCQGEFRLVVGRLGHRALADQHRVAIKILLIEIDLRLLGRNVALHALVVSLHQFNRQANLGEIGLGVIESDLVLARTKSIEHLAGGNVLIVGHVDLLDDAGDIAGNADLLGFHIGVIGRHHLTSGHVPPASGHEGKRQQRERGPAHNFPLPRLGRDRCLAQLRLTFWRHRDGRRCAKSLASSSAAGGTVLSALSGIARFSVPARGPLLDRGT